jgi:hypothetical protein
MDQLQLIISLSLFQIQLSQISQLVASNLVTKLMIHRCHSHGLVYQAQMVVGYDFFRTGINHNRRRSTCTPRLGCGDVDPPGINYFADMS